MACNFYQGKDSLDGNREFVGHLPIKELTIIAKNKEWCIGFNSLGFLKDNIDIQNLKSINNSDDNNDGLYVFTDKIPGHNPISVKLLCNWTNPKKVLEEFTYMLNDKTSLNYGKHFYFTEAREADYYVIINYPRRDDFYEPHKSIIIQMEPWCADPNQRVGVKTWGAWSNPDPDVFLKVLTTRTSLNLVQWIFDLTPKEILAMNIQKTKVLSSICGPKYFDPGHINRVDFLKYLEETGAPFEIDIYGFNNKHKFANYRGPLDKVNKFKGYLPYKYYLIAENNREANYITEKLWEPILCDCLAFYDGSPNASDYIDPRAFIKVDLSKKEEAYQIIADAIQNDEWSKRIDVIRREKIKIINELGFMPTIERVILEHRADQLLLDRYIFLPKIDQMGSDLVQTKGVNMKSECGKALLDKLLVRSLKIKECVAVNTLGFSKFALKDLKSSPYFGENDGVYIKREYYNEFFEKGSYFEFVWQRPCITELSFYEQNRDDPDCLQAPWANLIDKRYYTSEDQLVNLIKNKYPFKFDGSIVGPFYTCCQHVGFRTLIPLFKSLNINIVYSPHKVKGEDFINGVEIKPCPLYAVNYEDPERNMILKDKEYLKRDREFVFSFQGCHQKNYISNIRKEIFEQWGENKSSNIWVKNTDNWHFNADVYTKYFKKDYQKQLLLTHQYNQTILNSRYSLCPSGAGPNSLRLWESLAVGSIPIILADTLELPEHPLWRQSCLIIPEREVGNLMELIDQISKEREDEMRSNCLKLYDHFRSNYKNLLSRPPRE